MYSMTGYGKAEYENGGIELSVELKSVNNRVFDFNLKSPRAFIALEDAIRKTVMQYISRGRIDLFINFSDRRENENALTLDENRALAYFNSAKILAEKTGLKNDCTVTFLLKCPDVLTDDNSLDTEELKDALISTVKNACENFNEMRRIEGEKLCNDMLYRMDTIESIVNKIKERAPFVAEEYREKLKNRITEVLKDVNFDETRLLNEVACYTDKVNIDEEITRLFSHVSQFKSILKTKGSGKKLDFLMQEFNREANTICSKSNDLKVTGFGLELKNEIEKVREQVQNLE